MSTFAFTILPYCAAITFVAGMLHRIRIWIKSPMPSAITLFPAPEPGAGIFMDVIRESFLFPGLFKGDKAFWAMSWLFHVSLALILVGHLRVFTGFFDQVFLSLGMTSAGIKQMSAVSGGVAGIVIMAAAILLIGRRIVVKRVREVSNPTDYLALLLVLGILITGNLMRFGTHFDLAETREYFTGLFSFSWSTLTIPSNGIFRVHFLMVMLLVIYIPFSKILHFGGIFFTKSLIKKA